MRLWSSACFSEQCTGELNHACCHELILINKIQAFCDCSALLGPWRATQLPWTCRFTLLCPLHSALLQDALVITSQSQSEAHTQGSVKYHVGTPSKRGLSVVHPEDALRGNAEKRHGPGPASPRRMFLNQ